MKTQADIRNIMRARRQELTADEQLTAATDLATQITAMEFFQDAQHIGVYMASDGEVSPQKIVDAAWEQGKQCYLPVIDPDASKVLRFVEYTKEQALEKNRYNIPEPNIVTSAEISAQELDLVLSPLVAFDSFGNRIGMGAGYYDRSFAFLREKVHTKPFLVGLAHECQHISVIEPNAWDVKLHAIITDKTVWRIHV